MEHGLDAFADYEVLELLLFYAIPRQDTKPLARALLARFGSLEGVFAAPVEELCRVEGVGENAAGLLRLMLPLYRRIRISRRRKEVILNSVRASGDYAMDLFAGAQKEAVYLLCLDAKCKLITCTCLSEGDVNTVFLNVRRILETALVCRAVGVILTHNHPSGVALPSAEDTQVTMQVKEALQVANITLIDHIIVADEDFVSLAASAILT